MNKTQYRVLWLLLFAGVSLAMAAAQAAKPGATTQVTTARAAAPGTLDAAQAFEKLKTLAGRWEGTSGEGIKGEAIYELTSGDSALLERMSESGPEHTTMVTVYHLDGPRLLLTHYCATKNQPRMRAVSYSPENGTLAFEFLDATNLASPDVGHMHRAVYNFMDADHVTAQWSWRQGGNEVTHEFHYTRKH